MISPEALPEQIKLISAALENAVMFLELRKRAMLPLKSGQAVRPAQPANQLRDGDFAANGVTPCAEPLFHRFLGRKWKYGAIHNTEHADNVLKGLLGITSKTQLNKGHRKVKGLVAKVSAAALAYAACRRAILFHICMAAALSSR
ncbi:hypothetical protein RMR21_018310 [Agrobacterium sp. rho-8.1]